jgi:hypothetical protein
MGAAHRFAAGLNVEFAPADAWEKLIILSPQPSSRVKTEVEEKAGGDAAQAVVVPDPHPRRRARHLRFRRSRRPRRGRSRDLGLSGADAVERGLPGRLDLLTRKVNEYEGQHRFGGGSDGDCDPHVMDILAGATPEASEVEAQHQMLRHECNEDGSAKQLAVLTMVRKARLTAAGPERT